MLFQLSFIQLYIEYAADSATDDRKHRKRSLDLITEI